MAKYNTADIINEVKVILTENENAPMLETEGMDDISLERDTLIAHLIPVAINKILDIAPLGMLKGMGVTYKIDDADIDSNYKRVCVPIKNNVLRIMSARVKGWQRQIHALYTDESDEWILTHSRYPSWTPSPINPIGFLSYNENDELEDCGRVAELMPGTDEKINKVKLIVLNRLDTNKMEEYYDMTEECYHPLLYMIAGLYYTSMKDLQMAQTMTTIATESLGLAAKAVEDALE